jgi:hypothetical protein
MSFNFWSFPRSAQISAFLEQQICDMYFIYKADFRALFYFFRELVGDRQRAQYSQTDANLNEGLLDMLLQKPWDPSLQWKYETGSACMGGLFKDIVPPHVRLHRWLVVCPYPLYGPEFGNPPSLCRRYRNRWGRRRRPCGGELKLLSNRIAVDPDSHALVAAGCIVSSSRISRTAASRSLPIHSIRYVVKCPRSWIKRGRALKLCMVHGPG